MNDSHELSGLVERRIAELEHLSWAELVDREGNATHETVELGDTPYVLESQVVWDDRKGGDLRIIVDVYRDQGMVSRSLIVADRIIPRPVTARGTSAGHTALSAKRLRRLIAALRRR